MSDAPTKAPPPRSAVVINTKDGRRLKPPCPICSVTSWAKPRLGDNATPEDEKLQPVATAMRGEDLLSLPVAMFICQNCGFVMNIALNTNREYKIGE